MALRSALHYVLVNTKHCWSDARFDYHTIFLRKLFYPAVGLTKSSVLSPLSPACGSDCLIFTSCVSLGANEETLFNEIFPDRPEILSEIETQLCI